MRNSFWLPQVPGGPEEKTFWFSIQNFFNVWGTINRLDFQFNISNVWTTINRLGLQFNIFNVWGTINHLGLTRFDSGKICFFFSSNESLLLFSVNPFKRFWCATIPTFLEANQKSANRSLANAEALSTAEWSQTSFKKMHHSAFSSTRARACQLYENIFMTMPGWELVVNEPVLSFVCKVVS